jgi:hypothetical protein
MSTRGLKRKMCDAAPCPPSPFFHPAPQRAPAEGTFFGDTRVQRQEKKDDERKDPLAEGLKLTAEKALEHAPVKQWYEPRLQQLKTSLWDRSSTGDKAAMLTFLGLNLGTAATAFALDPKLRATLSDVNIGKPLGWIPYSPVEGFKYKLPKQGESAYGLSADFTLNPYLAQLRKSHPGFPLSGATFGVDSAYDPAHGQFGFTGGKFGLEFFGGGLKAEGKTFKDLSPYPLLVPGTQPGMPASWLMQQMPGLPHMGSPGYQFTVNADLLKLFPGLAKKYW